MLTAGVLLPAAPQSSQTGVEAGRSCHPKIISTALTLSGPGTIPNPAERGHPLPWCLPTLLPFLGSLCTAGEQELLPGIAPGSCSALAGSCPCLAAHQPPAHLVLPAAAPGPVPSGSGCLRRGTASPPGSPETHNTCPQKSETRHQPLLWGWTSVLRLQLLLGAPPPSLLCSGTTLAPQITGQATFPQPALIPSENSPNL